MDDILRQTRRELAAVADPEKAGPMAAYMKTDMKFHGVQKPDRKPILRKLKEDYRPSSVDDVERVVLALWAGEFREEKYLAVDFLCDHRKFHRVGQLPLCERLIIEGAWWDFVDAIASHPVGFALGRERTEVRPILEQWLHSDNMWLRRSTIISQIRLKDETDANALFSDCLECADEKEFFIRKAIGWALREYSKAAPEAVRDFLVDHRDQLSPLSFREGAKRLVREGWDPGAA
ncbi:MAG: DNA alkylation repair protein [Planctomycetota bacterium]